MAIWYALCHGRVVCGNLEQGVFEMYVQGSGEGGEGGQAGSADLWGLEGRGEPWQRLEYWTNFVIWDLHFYTSSIQIYEFLIVYEFI